MRNCKRHKVTTALEKVISVVILISLSLFITKLNATPLSDNTAFHNNTLTTGLHTDHNLQQNLPNSISGIKKNAKVGDFVMLKGRFIRKVDTNVLEFTDDGKQAVLVNFDNGKDTDFIKGEFYKLNFKKLVTKRKRVDL